MATNEPGSTRTTAAAVSRRRFLFLVGGALNAVAATLLAIPVIRYVFSSFRRNVASQSWIMLGALEKFPENQTRLATYRNPYTRPWDGTTAEIPCWVRRLAGEKFQVFAINCTHLGCPVRWFEESTMALTLPGRRRAGSTNTSTRLSRDNFGCAAGSCQLCLSRFEA